MRFKLPAFILLIALIGFIACKKGENFTSRIYFINGSLGFPPVTLKSDSLPVFTNITYDSVLHTQVTPSGTWALSFSAPGVATVADTTNLESGATYTSVLYDTATSAKIFIRKDVLPATPGEGRCQIRFFNMIKNSNTLTLANDTFRYYATTGAFGSFSSGASFTEIDTIAKPSIRYDSAHFIAWLPTFRSGKIYSIFLTGRLNDTTISGMYKPKATIQVHNSTLR